MIHIILYYRYHYFFLMKSTLFWQNIGARIKISDRGGFMSGTNEESISISLALKMCFEVTRVLIQFFSVRTLWQENRNHRITEGHPCS
jgi:hypothetical protein